MKMIMKPIINNNGTSREDLVNARIEAREACLALMQALGAIAPNGRDYIGQPEACKRDLEIYSARLSSLDALYIALGEEAMEIQNG